MQDTFPVVDIKPFDEWELFYNNVLLKQKHADKIAWSSDDLKTRQGTVVKPGAKSGTERGEFAFGEITYGAFYELLQSKRHFPIRPGIDRFIDLGSGLGNVVLFMSYITGCSVTGIELDKRRFFESMSRREIYEKATSNMYMNELIPEKHEIVHYGDFSLINGDFFQYDWSPYSRLFSYNLAFQETSNSVFGKFLLECLPGSILVLSNLPTTFISSDINMGYHRSFKDNDLEDLKNIYSIHELKLIKTRDNKRTDERLITAQEKRKVGRNSFFIFKIKHGKTYRGSMERIRDKIESEFLYPNQQQRRFTMYWPPISEISLNRWQLVFYENLKTWIPSTKAYDPGFIDMVMRSCPISHPFESIDRNHRKWDKMSNKIPIRKIGVSLNNWEDGWFFQLYQIVIQFGRIPVFFPFSILGSERVQIGQAGKSLYSSSLAQLR